ncbi:type II toxin-antitoxin system Phd/YefM family antitoxin [Mycolicibacterium elephantis]|uniref:type II toxin-antitoxin system Phd/YefM family antitoxin n=1 Tax=Mycolicibacterium elephantis TaxID=81858 RepID=UPI00103EFD1A|nr:type II toxin-antitoxin system Phd/YefM family antitoxin [Mycolicibacterium elephantis]
MSSGQLATSRAHIYTMRYLNQHTAEVINEINRTDEPAVITLRGRFIALIAPLEQIDVESALSYSLMEESENVSQLIGDHTSSEIYSIEEATEKLKSGGSAEHPDKPLCFTMRFLNQRTAHVMQLINEAGQPAAITRRGRFVAFIVPLANTDVESVVLGAVLEESADVGQLLGASGVAKIYSTEEAETKLSEARREYY